MNKPYVLSIAGLDPCAGAGVLADIKTMEQCGVYGFGVATAITYQNEDEFDGLKWFSFQEIEKQLIPLIRKYKFEVIKIGLIENLETLDKTISLLKSNDSSLQIIWDPILSASAGFNFHSALDKEVLKKALDLIYLVTPNQPEYETLQLETLTLDKTNVLLKGGHRKRHDDVLIEPRNKNQKPRTINGCDKKLSPKHGSGCVLSSSIASYLALGNDLLQSCTLGKHYVETVLASNEGMLGYHYNKQS